MDAEPDHQLKILATTIGLFVVLFLSVTPLLKKDMPIITGYFASLTYWLGTEPSQKSLAYYKNAEFEDTQKEKVAYDDSEVVPYENTQLQSITYQFEPEENEEEITSDKKSLFGYIKVVGGCTEYFEDGCLNVRSGPGTEYPVIYRLR